MRTIIGIAVIALAVLNASESAPPRCADHAWDGHAGCGQRDDDDDDREGDAREEILVA